MIIMRGALQTMPRARWEDTLVDMLKSSRFSKRYSKKSLRRILFFGSVFAVLYTIRFFFMPLDPFYENLKTLPHLSVSQASPSLPGVCVVVATMNRNAFVLSALQNWLSFPSSQLNEIIIVDWSSDVPFSKELQDSKLALDLENRVLVLRIEGQQRWILGLAYNAGVRMCRREYVLKLDAESHLNESFFDAHVLPPQSFRTGNWRLARNENELHLNGIIYVRRADFALVNGYDERIQTYGWDDTNLYERLVAANLAREHIHPEYIKHIEHNNLIRIAHSLSIKGESAPDHDFGPEFETQKNRRRTEMLAPWSQTMVSAMYRVSRVSGKEITAVMEYRPHSNRECISDEVERGIHVEILKASLIKFVPSLWEMRLPVNHLETMYREYTRPQPIMIVHVLYAIGARLQAMAQAWAVAQKGGRALRIVWDQGDFFKASYHDLFEPHPDFDVWDSATFDSREVYGNPNFLVLDFEKNSSWEARHVNISSPLNLYIRLSAQWLVPEIPFEVQSQFLQSLKPSAPLLKMIEGMHLPSDLSKRYGILATSDNSQINENAETWNAFSEVVETILSKDASARFLVHLDGIAISKLQNNLQRLISEKRNDNNNDNNNIDNNNNAIMFLLPSPLECSHNDASCVQQILANMITLSKTKALLGTFETTMTQLTARMSLMPCFAESEMSLDKLLLSGWVEGRTERPGVCH